MTALKKSYKCLRNDRVLSRQNVRDVDSLTHHQSRKSLGEHEWTPQPSFFAIESSPYIVESRRSSRRNRKLSLILSSLPRLPFSIDCVFSKMLLVSGAVANIKSFTRFYSLHDWLLETLPNILICIVFCISDFTHPTPFHSFPPHPLPSPTPSIPYFPPLPGPPSFFRILRFLP